MARKPAEQSVNKEDIITAAADVLRNNGYDATTMKDIAARVNLTAASLYHHFKNKDFLLLSVLELGLNYAIDLIEPIANSDLSSSEKLREMIGVHVVSITKTPAFGAAMVFEIRPLITASISDEQDHQEFMERRDTFFGLRDYFESLFRHVIDEGINRGEFREVDVNIVTKAMLGAHNWVGIWYNPDGKLSGEEIAERMADTFVHTLMPK